MSVNDKTKARIATLKNIFQCNLRDIPVHILKAVHVFHQHWYPPMLVPRTCFVNAKQKKLNEKCLRNLIGLCKNASVIVAKEIDFQLNGVLELTKSFPRLKVIHLLRDPRGMINSVENLQSSDALIYRLKHQCECMKRDIRASLDFMKAKSVTILPVLYECLATNPYSGFKKLYTFTLLRYSKATGKWILQNTNIHGNGSDAQEQERHLNLLKKDTKETERYATRVQSAIVSAYRWRMNINPVLQQSVDLICADVYSHLGLVAIHRKVDLRNVSFHLRVPNKKTYVSNFCDKT